MSGQPIVPGRGVLPRPQTFVPNIFAADEADFIKTTNSVYRSKRNPTHLEVGVLP